MKTIHGFLVCSMAVAAFAVSSCTAFGPMPTGTACEGDADDGIACTVDVCAADGDYDHIPNDGACASDEMCTSIGCVDRDPACPASCDDEVACTADSCVDGACDHVPNHDACPSDQRCGSTGCYTPPTMEECSSNAACNDGLSCSADRCVSGECLYNDACPIGQHCNATVNACVDDGPPPGDFRCVYTDGAHRIGYAVRVRATGMTGVRTIPSNTGETRAMSASLTRLWALGSSDGSIGGAGIDTGSDGWTTYSLVGTAGGRINVHPYVDRWRYGTPEFDRDILNIADLRSHVGATCASLGIEVQTCMNPSGCGSSGWVNLPARFCVIGLDTSGREFWNDPVIAPELRRDDVRRALIATDGSNDTASCAPVITD